MKSVIYFVGRAFQVIALLQTAYALVLGLQTDDATTELKLLLGGAIEFMIGQLLVTQSGVKSS